MQFFTRYNFKNNINSVNGTYVDVINENKKIKNVAGRRYTYKVVYDDDAKRNLVISGSEPVYEKIQTFKDDVDIYKIVARYLGGDITALDKNRGFYADLSKIPTNFNDFHNRVAEGQEIFAGLPTDFKEQFGNDVNRFMDSIYKKDFDQKLNDYIISKNPKLKTNGVVSNDNHNDVKKEVVNNG